MIIRSIFRPSISHIIITPIIYFNLLMQNPDYFYSIIYDFVENQVRFDFRCEIALANMVH